MALAQVQLNMPEAERELVERARAGDEDAFRMLMTRHRDRAYGIALRITRSPQDAEDVTQQAFVRVWRALPDFRGESSFATWLHRIVARRALDRASSLNSARAREEDLDPAASSVPIPAHERDVILLRRLEHLMNRLSAAQRAVIALHYWDEQSVEEIAAALAMPENTVKTHLRRARAALREAWLKTDVNR
jgi:RNA polymerase sigma-70 factor, ECF subfamily